MLTFAAAALCAHGKHVKKPDPDALQTALQGARTKFSSGADKAISAAETKGFIYSGASPAALADSATETVTEFVEKAAP